MVGEWPYSSTVESETTHALYALRPDSELSIPDITLRRFLKRARRHTPSSSPPRWLKAPRTLSLPPFLSYIYQEARIYKLPIYAVLGWRVFCLPDYNNTRLTRAEENLMVQASGYRRHDYAGAFHQPQERKKERKGEGRIV